MRLGKKSKDGGQNPLTFSLIVSASAADEFG
jgi:hypothetical protein